MSSKPVGASLRGQVKQVRHYFHPYREDRRSIVYDSAAILGLQVPVFRPRRRVAGSVWACSLVRDEIDVIDRTLDHFLAQGVDHVLVADNGSRDGTLERLRHRAAVDPRIHVAIDRERRFFHGAKMTRLAQVAAIAGADWVVPFDADELWFAPEATLASYLAASDANQVSAETFNAVPLDAEPTRAGRRYRLSSEPTGWYKVAFRAHPFARVDFGNHVIHRTGPRDTGLSIAHLAYRSQEHLRRKLIQGESAVSRIGERESLCYHWKWGARLSEPALVEVWQNVAAGRPDPRIDWHGLQDPITADLERWSSWEGPQVRTAPVG